MYLINSNLMLLIAFIINLIYYNKVNANVNIWDKLREESDLSQRNFVMNVKSLTCKNLTSEQIIFYNCEVVQVNNINAVNSKYDILQKLEKFTVAMEVILNTPGGKKINLFNKPDIDGCKFLEFKNEIPLIKILYTTLNSASNLPKKCPVAPFTYEMKNFVIDADKFPAYFPDCDFEIRIKLFFNGAKNPAIDLILLGEFYTLLEKFEVANATVTYRRATLFIPTNEAFSKFTGELTENLVLYHIATAPLPSDQLRSMAISSDVDGNLPLYIKQTRKGETFINNARIVPSRTLELENHMARKQVIYVIDQVLEPLTQTGPQNSNVPANPNAYQLLEHFEKFKIGGFGMRSYKEQVKLMKKENLYKSPGEHTFFFPIDLGFKKTARSALVDQKVIDSHVILNNPLFTAAAPLDQPQTTAAYEDNIKVSVTFFETGNKMYVKSNTIAADAKHPKGVVMAEIVKANIPVQNGVVHLISKPLMIIDSTVNQFLQDEENSALHKFYETIMEIGGEVLGEIASLPSVTILAPSNEAWNNANINNVIRNRQKMKDILNMHVIRDKLDIATIRSRNENKITLFPTLNNRTALYFNILDDSITVEGRGVNATIVQSDIAQTNGFVHIIDKVLGVPYTTVLGKLKEDPMLNGTYTIGSFSTFNNQLDDNTKRYTYFVTRDKGWEALRNDQPSKYKKMFMSDFKYHSTQLLERHLVISDRVYRMKDLVKITNTEGPTVLPSQRDSLEVSVFEELGRYYIRWNLKKISVFRADVECTNGIIHVLDEPFMDNSDFIVTGSLTGFATRTTYSAYQLIASFLMIIVAKLLL